MDIGNAYQEFLFYLALAPLIFVYSFPFLFSRMSPFWLERGLAGKIKFYLTVVVLNLAIGQFSYVVWGQNQIYDGLDLGITGFAICFGLIAPICISIFLLGWYIYYRFAR